MDFLHDKTAAILGYAFEQNLLPEFIKEASMPTQEEVKDLKDNAFANPLTREYPCHNKQATVLSALYAAANYEDEAVLDNIKKMASTYAIDSITQPIFSHFENQLEKYASEKAEEKPMVKFALSLEKEDGSKTNHYNITTKEDTLLAVKHLERDYNSGAIAPRYMRKIASVVINAAKEFDIAEGYIPSILTKFATEKLPEVATAMQLVSLRKSATVDVEPYEQVIIKLANDISNSDMSDESINSCADEALASLYELDKANNIKYAAAQPDPYDIIFTGPTRKDFEKFAAEHVRINDIPVPVVDVINLHEERIDANFNKQAANIIKEAKSVLQGSPSVDKSEKAANILKGMSKEASHTLLNTLADTGW